MGLHPRGDSSYQDKFQSHFDQEKRNLVRVPSSS